MPPESSALRPIVGSSPPRKEGRAKLLGSAQYVDDLTLPGMGFGATVRSTIARGRITGIAFPPHIPWHEFTIVTAADIPGENTIVHLGKDHPCLADGFVNHHSEPILLLAHPDRAVLPAAVAAVQITYEELPGVFTIEDSEAKHEIIWGEGEHANTFKTYLMQKGTDEELAAIFAEADHIVEGEYTTGAQEQLYIENNGMIAEYLEDGSVKVQGCMQCPYYLVHALTLVFNLPEEKCRVLQTETGGAFGGKEDFPSVIGSHAALLAMKSGHPVKLCYDRAEDMAATTKRHPSRTRHRTAVSKDGRLLGGEIAFAIDGGAYSTLSPVVLSRGTIHSPRPLPLARPQSLRQGHGHQHRSPRSLPRLRRTAIHLRPRAPPRQNCQGRRPLPRTTPPPQLPGRRRPHRHRPAPRRPHRPPGPPHPRPHRIRLPPQAG